jgi:hypothetical protein
MARVHFAMKMEFKLLKNIIRDYTPKEYEYDPDIDEERQTKQADYDMVEVIPVSDPNATTMAQRIVQYQAAFQMAQSQPDIYDMPYLHRQMIEILGVKNVDKIIPNSEEQAPKDPVSENMAVLIGSPIQAFIHQDHAAHMAVHNSFMQDPNIAANIGQNPNGQKIMAALHAHIAEHLGFEYRNRIEEQLGTTLPPPDEELPDEIEAQLSRLVADAGRQLTQVSQQQAAQAQAQQQAQDPLFQLEQAKLQIQQQEQQRKVAKDQTDAAIAAQKLQLDKERIQIEAAKEGTRVQSQERQASNKLKFDALKMMATPKQKPPKGS